ncbi:hypothetical protein FB567DRAFT_547711 [Paraphoma chrysanthemicola]|uniref:Uncharacterized protein n=1 Tax=Paraphoma chrysanthemicola TaxID=798071 RepID=A0A8K0RAL7_9PLEO|nr:hypothetical protein FB567DRAFT_547711 [Paraphoma chrysanthemicola]
MLLSIALTTLLATLTSITTTIPGPATACPTTRTTTSNLPCQTACPRGCGTYVSTLTYSSSCVPSTTPPPRTITAPTRPCYTHTTTTTAECAESGKSCAAPDCLYLSTTRVPAGPVEGCVVTPTVTETRSSVCGVCDGGCGTVWATESVTAW